MEENEVLLTRGAESDLAELYDYLVAHESAERAAELLDRVLGTADALAELPERGQCPRELEALGVREYRQVLVGPYRIVYRRVATRVYIYLIVDGRRDMQSLLERRLLGR